MNKFLIAMELLSHFYGKDNDQYFYTEDIHVKY